MKVLVTGNLGYLGTHVSASLLRAGHEVAGYDAGWFRSALFSPAKHMLPAPKALISQSYADIRHISATDLAGYDAVIHLAGLSNDPLGDFDPALTMEINYRAAVRLAKCAKEAGVSRFVFASTCSVYGSAGDQPLCEEARFNPVSAYGRAKALADREIAALASDDFAPVILRPGTVFGPAPMLRFDLVANNMLAYGIYSGELLMKSTGASWRPLIDCRDVAHAFAAVINAPSHEVSGQAFNVVTDQGNMRMRDLAALICEKLPDVGLRMADSPIVDHRNYHARGDKLAALLGQNWSKHELGDVIPEMATLLLAGQFAPEDFEGPCFQRLAMLKAHIRHGRLDDKLYQRAPIGALPAQGLEDLRYG